MYNCFKNDLGEGKGGRETLKEEGFILKERVLFHVSYYNLTVLKQVFLTLQIH